MKETKVKSYTRKTKSGKTIMVKAHSRKCEGDSCKSAGAGREFVKSKRGKKEGFDISTLNKSFGVKDDEKELTSAQKRAYVKEHGFTKGGMKYGRRVYNKKGKSYTWNFFGTKLVPIEYFKP